MTFLLSKGYFPFRQKLEPSQKCAYQQEDDFKKKPFCTKYSQICQWRSLKPCSVMFGEGTHASSKSAASTDRRDHSGDSATYGQSVGKKSAWHLGFKKYG